MIVQITSIEGVQNLTELQKLDLSFNDSFYNSKSLETLILSNNKLDLRNNSHILFNVLTNLKFLNLSSNCIELIQLDTFSNILKLQLKVVDLSMLKSAIK